MEIYCYINQLFTSIYIIKIRNGGDQLYWETLPTWIWIIYYSVFLLTFILAIFSIKKKKLRVMSFLAILFIISIPIISLLYTASSDRQLHLNEYEFFIIQLQQGVCWAIYVLIGYIVLLSWWFLFLMKVFWKEDS